MTPTSARILSGLTDVQQRAAMTRFRQRIASGALSPAITGVTRIKRLDASGDTELLFPRVDLSRLEELEEDERVATALGEQVLARAQAAGATIVALTPGASRPQRLPTVDLAQAPEEIVILSPIVGG